jgi:hypothetical protein
MNMMLPQSKCVYRNWSMVVYGNFSLSGKQFVQKIDQRKKGLTISK